MKMSNVEILIVVLVQRLQVGMSQKNARITLVTLNMFLCLTFEALKLNDIQFDFNVSATLIDR